MGPFVPPSGPERATVTAIQLRMRMRVLTCPANLLGNFRNQIKTRKDSKLSVAKAFASDECESFCERNGKKFILAAEIPCEWKLTIKCASDCKSDGLVHAVTGPLFTAPFLLIVGRRSGMSIAQVHWALPRT